MKAIIRIFIDKKEVNLDNINEYLIKKIQKTINEWLSDKCEEAYSDFNLGYDAAIININNEFITSYMDKMIVISPENVSQNIQVVFNYAGEGNWICYCRDVDCPGGCGTLSCGCIDICRGRCGLRDY